MNKLVFSDCVGIHRFTMKMTLIYLRKLCKLNMNLMSPTGTLLNISFMYIIFKKTSLEVEVQLCVIILPDFAL